MSALRMLACGKRYRACFDAAGDEGFEPSPLINKKEKLPVFTESFWQGMKDSNPHKRSQSPVCYHYTNPLRTKVIIHDLQKMSTLIFEKF